jgi:Tfp pilus assembly protein PilX
MRLDRYPQSKSVDYSVRSEQGSTLIPVLFILLIITVLGLMAMRQGLVNLSISTNSQVKQLLVQSADAPLYEYSILDVSVGSPNISLATVLGNALDPSNLGRELVFCYKSSNTQSFGLVYNASTIQAVPSPTAGSNTSNIIDNSGNGFCSPTSDFTSGRKAVVTQVAVLQPTDASTSAPGAFLARATSVGGGDSTPKGYSTKQRFRVISTSFLPGMGSTALSTSDATKNCLQGRISDNSDPANANSETVTDCLARNGIPVDTQVQEYGLTTSLTQTTDIN